jgi:AcrR family transcriptional regulator
VPAPVPSPRSEATFTNTARRRQLVDAAIGLIADVGLSAASTVQIALAAGVSRGVLTHHFADKDDLIDAVVAEVYAVGSDQVGAAVAAADSPRAKLLAFVGSSVELYGRYPDHLAALGEIFAARRRVGRDAREREALHTRELHDVATLLRAGQAAGELRAFDAETMAVTIRSTLDGSLRLIRSGADVSELRDELVATIDRATRQGS